MPSPSIELALRPFSGLVAHPHGPDLNDEEGPPRDPLDVAGTDFPLAVRGYDRAAVDDYLDELQRWIDDLRAASSPPEAVRRALNEVGEETSAILRRAHDTAAEITSRSRAEADRLADETERAAHATLVAAEARAQHLDEEAARRVAEAERSAEAIRAEAEARARELDVDTDRIWGERQKLLEDVERTSRLLTKVAQAAARRFPAEEVEGQPAVPSSSRETVAFDPLDPSGDATPEDPDDPAGP